MKAKIRTLALAVAVAFTGAAYGQTSTSNSGAGASSNVTANPTNVNLGNGASTSSSGSQAGASSQTTGNSVGVTVQQDFRGPTTTESRISGTTTENVNINHSGVTTENHNTNVSGTTTLKNVPNVVPPNILPTSPCMGSSSLGGSVAGFGIGGGTSWKDGDCGYRETARVFMQAGRMDDGMAVLCASEYAANAPTCKKLKQAEAEAVRVASARQDVIRTQNDAGRNSLTNGTMSKSQYDTQLTLALASGDKGAQCDVYRRTGDNILMNRMGCSGK